MEVLPNGVLVVQAARDITVGNDRQTVLIRGLIRTGDLAPDNSLPPPRSPTWKWKSKARAR